MGKHLNLLGRRDLPVLTIHQESVLLSQKGRFSAEKMHHKDMVPGTTVVTLDSERPSLMLHGEIGSDGSGTVTNEVVCSREPFGFQQYVEKVIESFLGSDGDNERRISEGDTYLEDERWTEVGRD